MRMRFLAVLACVAVLSGCGETPVQTLGAEGTATPFVAPSYAPVSKQEACPDGEPVHLPAETGTIEAAYVCRSDYRPVPGDGEWSFDVVRGITDRLDELVQVYATADAPRSGVCTTELPDPLVVYLHGARTLAVRAPLNACGKPTQAARAAYEALVTTVVSETKANRGRSQVSIDTGCSDDYKDMLALEEPIESSAPPAATPEPLDGNARACIYTVRGTEDVGHLSSTRTFTAGQLAELNEALAGSRADSSCSRHGHTRFTLIPGGQGMTTLVALDGCAVQQDTGWWRATDRLRQLIAA